MTRDWYRTVHTLKKKVRQKQEIYDVKLTYKQ